MPRGCMRPWALANYVISELVGEHFATLVSITRYPPGLVGRSFPYPTSGRPAL